MRDALFVSRQGVFKSPVYDFGQIQQEDDFVFEMQENNFHQLIVANFGRGPWSVVIIFGCKQSRKIFRKIMRKIISSNQIKNTLDNIILNW